MKCRHRIFAKTGSFCIALFGIAIFASSCESKVDPTIQATTKASKLCSFHNINYRVGDNWNPFLLPKGYYRCITCICELTKVGSMDVAHVTCSPCKKPTKNVNNPPNKKWKSCTHNSILRNHGAVWAEPTTDPDLLQANHCKECSCTDGFTTCATRNCPVLSCKNQTNVNGACCPVCAGDLQRPRHPSGCQTMGRYYDHMETWHPRIPPRYDMCINCTCKNTTIECRNRDCPKITCVNPQRKPGDCCDSCPVTHNPGECEWGKKKYPHNSSFHPTVGPIVVVCVKCVCNASKLDCTRLTCPTTYPCRNPMSVTGKCCKVCNDNGEGSIPEIPTTAPGNGAERPCSSGKYWMVYEYEQNQTQNISSEMRVQFVLEDREHDAVEIHTINANMTVKTVKVSNITKSQFDIFNSNNEYKDLGKIREGQRNKIKIWEQRACHPTHGCIRTVEKIMERLRQRVKKCDSSMPRPPDSLLKLDESP